MKRSADAARFYEIHSIEFRLTNELHCKYSVTRSLIAVTQHGGVTVYRGGPRLFFPKSASPTGIITGDGSPPLDVK